MRKICKHIFDFGGHIEYIGCVYEPNGCDNCEDEKADYNPFEACVIKYGCYCIWIPTKQDKQKYIKVDLIVKSPSDKIASDYTVNALEYGKNVTNPDQYIQDLCNKIIRPLSPMTTLKKYDLAKKLYRMKKIWDKKYRPITDKQSVQDLKEAFEKIEDFDCELKFFKAGTPSYDDHKPLIRTCKHKYDSITMQQFNSDPVIQQIKMWLKV
jgi:hypothetical protein